MYSGPVQWSCTCTVAMYSSHVQWSCTVAMYSGHVQWSCTVVMYMYMYSGPVQWSCTCTVAMYSGHVQWSCTVVDAIEVDAIKGFCLSSHPSLSDTAAVKLLPHDPQLQVLSPLACTCICTASGTYHQPTYKYTILYTCTCTCTVHTHCTHNACSGEVQLPPPAAVEENSKCHTCYFHYKFQQLKHQTLHRIPRNPVNIGRQECLTYIHVVQSVSKYGGT